MDVLKSKWLAVEDKADEIVIVTLIREWIFDSNWHCYKWSLLHCSNPVEFDIINGNVTNDIVVHKNSQKKHRGIKIWQ